MRQPLSCRLWSNSTSTSTSMERKRSPAMVGDPHHRFRALLIGVAAYDSLDELRGPVVDVARMTEALTDQDVGMFDRAQVKPRTNLTKAQAIDALRVFYDESESG